MIILCGTTAHETHSVLIKGDVNVPDVEELGAAIQHKHREVLCHLSFELQYLRQDGQCYKTQWDEEIHVLGVTMIAAAKKARAVSST
eukprot:1340619-Amphidinium_carterae.5